MPIAERSSAASRNPPSIASAPIRCFRGRLADVAEIRRLQDVASPADEFNEIVNQAQINDAYRDNESLRELAACYAFILSCIAAIFASMSSKDSDVLSNIIGAMAR